MNVTDFSIVEENFQITNETFNMTKIFQISEETLNITTNFQKPEMSTGQPQLDSYHLMSEEAVILIKKISYLGICPALTSGGLVFNFICLVMFCKLVRKTKTSTVIFLLSLAITDILYNITVGFHSLFTASNIYEIPFTADQRIQASPYFYSFVRPLPGRLGDMLTLVISLERLFCVQQPMKIRQYSTRKNALIAVTIVLVLVVTVTSPMILLYRPIQIYSNATNSFVYSIVRTELGKYPNLLNTLYVVTETLFGFIPVFGVSIASSLTMGIVVISARRRSKMTPMTKRQSNEINVTRTLLSIIFLFIICKLPNTLVTLIIFLNMEPYQLTSNVYDVALAVTYIPLVLNSVLNLVVYYKTSSVYKAKIRAMLDCSPSKEIKIIATKQLENATVPMPTEE